MRAPQVSVIIPCGPKAEISGLLEDLRLQALAERIEVIGVANPPDHRIESALRQYPSARYIASDRIGANRARNLGIDAAQGEIFLFLDADCRIPDPSFVSRHLALHRELPDFSAIGGSYRLSPGAGVWARRYAEIQDEWLESGWRGGRESVYLLGGNVSFKRDRIGENRFDEKLEFGGTETEFFLRLGALGHRWAYDLEIKVIHDARITLPDLLKKAYRQGIGSGYLEMKDPSHVSRLRVMTVAASRPSTRSGKGRVIYDLAYRAGVRDFARGSGLGSPASSRVLISFLREALSRRARIRRAPIWIEAEFAFKNALLGLGLEKEKPPLRSPKRGLDLNQD